MRTTTLLVQQSWKKAKNTRNIEANNEMKPMKGEKKMKKMTFFFPHLIILRFRACYFPFFSMLLVVGFSLRDVAKWAHNTMKYYLQCHLFQLHFMAEKNKEKETPNRK
jgi:hypothetical protein